jgi:hypothetical protein
MASSSNLGKPTTWSTTWSEHFARLQSYRIKLNPEKCVFGIPKGKLLGLIISERRIEVNPKKIMAIRNLGPISNLKGAQKLMGVPSLTEPIHLAARGAWDAAVQAIEEV